MTCGLCKAVGGPGVGSVCWVCQPPHANSAEYPSYLREMEAWRGMLRERQAEDAPKWEPAVTEAMHLFYNDLTGHARMGEQIIETIELFYPKEHSDIAQTFVIEANGYIRGMQQAFEMFKQRFPDETGIIIAQRMAELWREDDTKAEPKPPVEEKPADATE